MTKHKLFLRTAQPVFFPPSPNKLILHLSIIANKQQTPGPHFTFYRFSSFTTILIYQILNVSSWQEGYNHKIVFFSFIIFTLQVAIKSSYVKIFHMMNHFIYIFCCIIHILAKCPCTVVGGAGEGVKTILMTRLIK